MEWEGKLPTDLVKTLSQRQSSSPTQMSGLEARCWGGRGGRQEDITRCQEPQTYLGTHVTIQFGLPDTLPLWCEQWWFPARGPHLRSRLASLDT